MKNKKQIVVSLLTGVILGTTISVSAGTFVQAYRNEEIKVTLDGKTQIFVDEKTNEIEYPLTYNDRTYLPLRSLSNLLGFEVDYDEETKTAIIKTPTEKDKEETKVNTENKNEPKDEEETSNDNTNKNEDKTTTETNNSNNEKENESEENSSSENVKSEETGSIDKDTLKEVEVPVEKIELDKEPGIILPVEPKPTPEVM